MNSFSDCRNFSILRIVFGHTTKNNMQLKFEIKILEFTQREFSKLGICFGVKSIETRPFNSRNVFILIVLCLGTTSTCVDLFYTPKSFKEYTVSAYAVSAMLISTISFIGTVLKIPQMSTYLHCFENTINSSESKPFQGEESVFFSISKLYFRTCASHSPKSVYTNQSYSWTGMQNPRNFYHEISVFGGDAVKSNFELFSILRRRLAGRCFCAPVSILVSGDHNVIFFILIASIWMIDFDFGLA